MKNKKFFPSLQFKVFFLFTAIFIVVATILYAIFSVCLYRNYHMEALSHMRDIESLATGNINDQLEKIDQFSVSVLVNQVVQDNLEYINNHLELEKDSEQGNPYYRNIDAIVSQLRPNVFSISGIVSLRIYSLNGIELLIGTTNREYLEYSLTPEQIYEANGAALWERNGEKNYICMCRAILSTSTILPQGYMIIVCKNDYFSDRLSTIQGAYAAQLYLVDQNSQIVAASAADLVGDTFTCDISTLRQMGEGKYVKDPATGRKSFYFVGEELSNGWTLVTTADAEFIIKSITDYLIIMGGISLVVLAVALIFTNAGAKRLTAPTQTLLTSMHAFGQGNLGVRAPVTGKDEIGMISSEYNQMADNIQNLMEQVYALELSNKEAENEVLKMQITPHFLYNTLDTISWLGFTNGCEVVSDLAVSLARLLRASIQNSDFITVEKELNIIKNYLDIQRCRFQDRISVEYEIDPETLACYMPNFLLQPLVENSIMHGLENLTRPGLLKIQIWKKDFLMFCISDNGKGMDQEQVDVLLQECKDLKYGASIGLKNVYRRLQLLYGEECKFEIISSLDEGTAVFFRIPLMPSSP